MSGAQQRFDDAAASKAGSNALVLKHLESPALLRFIEAVAPGQSAIGLVKVAYAAVQANPGLARCSIQSLVRSVAEAAQLGFSVDSSLGHAYLVPYKGAAKMIVGYRGFEQLAYRSGLVKRIHADVVFQFDEFEYVEGSETVFRHRRPALGEPRGEVVGAYATATLDPNVAPLIAVLDLEELHARRSKSASWKRKPVDSPWTTDPVAMYRKTAIRALASRLPVERLQSVALRDEAREEGRRDESETLDLGLAEVVDGATEEAGGRCERCGSLHLQADGRCADCDGPKEVPR